MLSERLKSAFAAEAEGVLLTGSCSRGEATYRSDIDLLVVLKAGPLNYERVQKLRDCADRAFESDQASLVLKLEIHFVLPSVFETQEPAMIEAIRLSQVLVAIVPSFDDRVRQFKERHRKAS